MNEALINFPSRISARPVVSANFLVFSLMMLFMILGGGFNLWALNLAELPYLSNGFWVWGLVSWIVSLGIGSYMAAIIGKAVSWQDGSLYGLITWATSCIVGCLFLATTTGELFGREMEIPFLWGAFVGDLLALAVCLYAGHLGAKGELQLELSQETQEHSHRNIKLKSATSS
ncbi:MAG: hypothetical protein HOE90_22710 [Bacteriovoracaceae bacterium]|jgi:hypothetical protein|nr:hypothetical protein [Bacteriovoracaceae bacterium]